MVVALISKVNVQIICIIFKTCLKSNSDLIIFARFYQTLNRFTYAWWGTAVRWWREASRGVLDGNSQSNESNNKLEGHFECRN